jgi:hypothetical protein
VDSQRPSACYLVSDSRIFWPTGHWDAGQKLFVSSRFPDIFGYCGDVQFPTLALRQVVDRIEQGILFASDADSERRHRTVCAELERAYSDYPAHPTDQSTILHFSRDGTGKAANFRLWRLDWSKASALRSTSVKLPETSVIGVTIGSGWRILIDRNEEWKKVQGRTARGVFSSFCDALASGEDPHSGGPPQLAGLYPSGSGRLFGTILGQERHLAGAPVPDDANVDDFEWRNCLFERMDPRTLRRLPGAQRQPRPRMRSSSVPARRGEGEGS